MYGENMNGNEQNMYGQNGRYTGSPNVRNYDPTKDYTPIGMWGYFGYEILFAIPVIGWLCLIIFALGGTKNVNLRNLARSWFCLDIIAIVVVLLIMVVIGSFIGY